MFSSSLPLGLVWIAIPAWMARIGVDIKVVGLFTLAQAPWSFKFLWSPFMDRYPLPFLGRKRGYVLVTQILLLVLGLWLAGAARHPDAIWVIGALSLAIAFASATQDIAYDAYAVEVLREEEHGVAAGARGVLGRSGIWLAGIAITFAGGGTLGGWVIPAMGWPLVNLILALCYIPMLFITWFAPEPEVLPPPPRTLREAVWEPFVGFLAQHRALEVLSFVVLFKFSDNLTQALLRPFFVKAGYNDVDVGFASMTVGTFAISAGVFIGGVLTGPLGLGRALWIFGLLQIFSNLGYAVVAELPTRPILYAAQAFEMGTSGLGTGAFSVLLLRLTQKRFSATQYALLTSLMSITRVLTGPPAGLLADAFGWRDFFILTIFTGIPGMIMLQRFVPWSVRDPVFHVAEPHRGYPLTPGSLALRAIATMTVAWAVSLVTMASLAGARAYRAGRALDLANRLWEILLPSSTGNWLTAAGIFMFALLVGVSVAATLAARRGIAGSAAAAGGVQ
jgi:PAT family beta-lactamase induction signal transducer AmpG